MKISSVEAYLLSYPLPQPIRLLRDGEQKTIFKRDAMLIRIASDEGIFGYAPGPPALSVKQTIDRLIAPFLLGRSPEDPDALRAAFQQGAGSEAETSRIFGSVEIALYDLAGKIRGAPVSELIGGRVRDRIRLYASAGLYCPAEDCAAEAAAAREMGFRAYKMRAGRGAQADVAAVRAVRDRSGPDFEIMVDAHAWWRMGDRSYSAATVERIAAEMAESRIRWLEEPLPPDDHDAYIRLKQRNLAPLASGEHEPNELRFLDLIERGAVDYVQMDLVSQGGYATARRLFPDIARAGMRFAFHSWGTGLELAAAAQLGVCWPEPVVRWLEYPCYSTDTRSFAYPFPLASEILKQPLAIERGELVVPRAPGLGVDVDESVIWRYPWLEGASCA
ncbi:MAG TPA: mandelate racemase/muconate lactonizing enzyme family protein [Bryobacteraceae bacterium]|jgi:L-alanine-DL-glutamate epimerase-like enolase superfamily enzyme|nr:mandelate racemase/muconate lactonizing enzyme family protein [Bryobacteraceae bacterium]